MPHPYDEHQEKSRPRYRAAGTDNELEELVNGAVQFGSRVGSSVLGSIADALRNVSLDLGLTKEEATVASRRRRLDRKLSEPYGGFLGMGITGWVLAGCFWLSALVMAILSGVDPASLGVTPADAQVFSVLTAVFAPVGFGFGAMGFIGCHISNYYKRLRNYLRQLRDWSAPVDQLARAALKKPEQARTDLQKAVSKGHLPGACLDEAGEVFYLDETLYQPPQPEAQTARPAQETLSEQEQFRRAGVDFLNYLRVCRGKLGADADAELAQMQKNCGVIFGFIHNHPDQLPRVRRFSEYYLPTTRKLLDTALGLGDVDAANAETIRRDITGILHTLNEAYVRLYDSLLQDVSLNVSAEIDTLEAMLGQDGLTRDFASDFGVQNP